MKTTKPSKYRSKILNLLFLAALVWMSFMLSATSNLAPPFKMIFAYISWGMMIYLLMGFLFTRKPSGTVASLGAIAALGAELGRFDLTSMAQFSGAMPIMMGLIMIFGLVFYGVGIMTGWMLESLLKGIWKRLWTEPGSHPAQKTA